MPLFFVLSGFVMQYNYAERITTLAGIYEFFVERFARLYPLYIVCLAFVLASSWGYGWLPSATPEALPYYLTLSQSSGFRYFGNTSLYAIFGWMAVSWSISTEFFFYLCFPLICLGTARLKSPRSIGVAIAFVTVAGLVIVAVLGPFRSVIDDFGVRHFTPLMAKQPEDLFWWLVAVSPYFRLLEFVLGSLFATLTASLARVPVSSWEQRLGKFLSWSAVALIALMYSLSLALLAWQWLLGLRICFDIAPPSGTFNLLLCALPQWRRAGTSCSLYLLHYPLIEAFMHSIRPLTSRAIEIADVVTWLLMMGSAVGLSVVSWRLIEVPARRWLRAALKPAKTAISGAPTGQIEVVR